MKNNKDDFLTKHISIILGIILFAALICGGVTVYFYSTRFDGAISSEHERWGTFGDFFGGTLNPIFSLFALLALLVTIIIQSKELASTREEFKKSTIALQDQGSSIKLQNFENTFFKLISLHNELIDTLVYRITIQKRACFVGFIKGLDLFESDTSTNFNCKKTPVNVQYNFEYDKIANSVEHYHKNLFQILSFIERSSLGEERWQYAKFIRAQLSRDELNLLFFHGLSKYGFEKFKPLIEKYAMLSIYRLKHFF